jgi:excinuclease ABC subunit A
MYHLHGTRGVWGEHDEIRGIEHIDKVVDIDQSPIGRTPRSNPATYTGVFDIIRDLFASTPDARIRGYRPGRFSFNVKGGRCEACKGDGIIKIEMHFLPDVYVPCEVCKGKRYNRETLEIKYKGKSIADVLDMTVAEALEFFKSIPAITRRLQTIYDVGLDYIKLGQPATTLSGGEAQRVKLAAELSKRATGRTLYILDEPTTGLHFADIRKLLDVLNRLTDAGNTVIVIEHNLDVIKTADYIIDLGPEGGEAGGQVVAVGTPEEVAQVESSYTGQFLRQVLNNRKHKLDVATEPKPPGFLDTERLPEDEVGMAKAV